MVTTNICTLPVSLYSTGSFSSNTSDMTSEVLGEMFEGDSAYTFAGKFLLMSMGGRVEGLACADPGARTPIGASGNFALFQANTFEKRRWKESYP